MNKRKLTIFSALALIFMAACAVAFTQRKPENTRQAAPEPVAYQPDEVTLTQAQVSGLGLNLDSMQARDIRPLIHANGVTAVLPGSLADVTSHIGGKVDQVHVRPGQWLEKGQVMLTLSSFQLIQLMKEYVSAHADAEYLGTEFRRQQDLQAKQIGVLADLQSVKARWEAAKANEHATRSQLTLLGIQAESLLAADRKSLDGQFVLRAPIAGYLEELNVHKGSVVHPEAVLARLANPEQTEARIFIFEKDAAFIQEGAEVLLESPQEGSEPVKGIISHLSPTLDPERKTLTAHVNLTASRGKVRMLNGMNVRASVWAKKGRSFSRTAPVSALYWDGDAAYVFAATPKGKEGVLFRKVRVEVLQQDDAFAAIQPVGQLPDEALLAGNMVLALEAERKKNER